LIAFVSKMDKERADFGQGGRGDVRDPEGPRGSRDAPHRREASFSGVIDLFRMKALVYKGDAGEFAVRTSRRHGGARQRRGRLIEACAEADDALIEKFLEGGSSPRRRSVRASGRACGQTSSCRPLRLLDPHRRDRPAADLINFALPDPSYRVR
jgi:elongation factor G